MSKNISNQPEPKVVFENKSLLVIDKPPGWVVNNAESVKTKTIQDWVSGNFDFPTANISSLRNGIVHRIDKETSGVLLIAKTNKQFRYLQRQFKLRKIKKTYICLVHGKIELKSYLIKAPVGRLPWNRERFGVLPGGKKATTKYELERLYKKKDEHYSLIKTYPKTGRTHQIRIHMKYVGHPLVSDSFYAGRKRAKKDRTWCPRLFLHAFSLEYKNYKGKIEKYESQLPDDLEQALSTLEIIKH